MQVPRIGSGQPAPRRLAVSRAATRTQRIAIGRLLNSLGLELRWIAASRPIPYSYWGAPEAGLLGRRVLARRDTPIHSILHEAGHAACMSPARRRRLRRDAGGDHAEENAVNYLAIALAERIPGMDRARICLDMDRWGYTFRLGSARAWLEHDAGDARAWLRQHHLIRPCGQLARGLARRRRQLRLAARAPGARAASE